MLQILMIVSLEQCAEFSWFADSIFSRNLYFLSTLLSFTVVQKVFGVVQLCSLSGFFVLSLSFEDALNSHSGIISPFFLRHNICILV